MKRFLFPLIAMTVVALPVLAARDEPAAGMPEAQAPNQKIFVSKCATCHPASRSYQARYRTEKEWQGLVARMARKPGATITRADQKKIVSYLTWYSTQKTK